MKKKQLPHLRFKARTVLKKTFESPCGGDSISLLLFFVERVIK